MTFDRILEPLAALVRRLTARMDYLGLYPCRVVAQNADGTLELQPDDARFPSLSSVPVFSGVAGASVTVTAGARVLAGFGAGDPSKPFAALWEPGTATIVFNGGTKEVARKDDGVSVTVTAADIIATGVLSSPTGGPLLPPPTPPVSPTNVSGKITSGAANVKA